MTSLVVSQRFESTGSAAWATDSHRSFQKSVQLSRWVSASRECEPTETQRLSEATAPGGGRRRGPGVGGSDPGFGREAFASGPPNNPLRWPNTGRPPGVAPAHAEEDSSGDLTGQRRPR